MSDTGMRVEENTLDQDGGESVSAYFQLLKPRVMSLVVFTALVGLVAAPGEVHPVLAFTALLCIAVGAGASGALNMWYDADIDAVMGRTAKRPIPNGDVSKDEALTLGTVLSIGSVLCLGILINWLAAALLALTIAYYVFFYTMWLKRRTQQNIVIGGAAGAFPPMVGWAAASGNITLESVVMFLIIFMWTPPHFWALALYRSRDYERAGVPMMPVQSGSEYTRKQIWYYSLILVPLGMTPYIIGLGGSVYLLFSVTLGAIFLFLAWRVYKPRKHVEFPKDEKELFRFSILYLFVLFAVLLVEHTTGLV